MRVRGLIVVVLVLAATQAALGQGGPSAIVLKLDPPNGRAAPGTDVTFLALVENPGDADVRVHVSATGDVPVRVHFPDITVGGRGVWGTTALVSVPANATPGPREIVVRATGGGSDVTARYLLEVVDPADHFVLSPWGRDPLFYVPLGFSMRIAAGVNATQAGSLLVYVESAPEGWKTEVEDPTLAVVPGVPVRTQVTVTPPEGAEGTVGTVRVAARHVERDETTSFALRIPVGARLSVDPPVTEPLVEVEELWVNATPGTDGHSFSVVVRNPDPAFRGYWGALDLPAGWSGYTFPDHAFVEAHGEGVLGAIVNASAEARDAEGRFRVLADGAGPTVRVHLRALGVEPTREIALTPADLEIVAGGVANVLARSDAPVVVRLELPAGLVATPSEVELVASPLGGYEGAFEVRADPTIAPGEYEALATGGAAASPMAIRVHASSVVAEGPDAATSALVPIGIVSGIAGASLALVGARRRWPIAFAALYSRLAPSEILQHPTRRRMALTIEGEPGITVGDLQRALGLSNGAFAHHLAKLERSRAIAVVADGQMRRLYRAGRPRPGAVPPLGERALAALVGRGNVPAPTLAKELGVSRQALHYHLKRLAKEGRVVGKLVEGELHIALRA